MAYHHESRTADRNGSGIASGVTLAIARVTGETAPILVTAGYAATNWNPFSEWMTALPVYIYRQLVNPTAPAAGDPSMACLGGCPC